MSAKNSPPSASELNLTPVDGGIAHELIIDGEIVEENLSLMGRDVSWLKSELSAQHTSITDVFLFTLDDSGKTHLVTKESKK